MKRHLFLIIGVILAVAGTVRAPAVKADDRPNILWIMAEDICPDLSCYGTKGVSTPNLDRLANAGARFTRAFTTAPVCSASRSAMLTGFHQNYIGANQHRTPNADKKYLPYGIEPIPNLLQDAGYFTCLMDRKTDHNFLTHRPLFMGKDWKQRKPGQPFFAQITFHGTHRSWQRDPVRPIDGKDVEIPAYMPDLPMVRRDFANGLEQIQLMDREVGQLLKRLKAENLEDNTLVFFIGDHGRCHIRGKQFLYDEGLHIPLLMRWPGHVRPGAVREELACSLDICATILDVAKVKPPVPLHGMSLFDDAIKQRKYIFAARDKMDDTHDAMRSIRANNYRLILNLMPARAWCQYNRYKEAQYPLLALMNVMNLKGQLTPVQAAFMAPHKPKVELYDTRKDPDMVHNVADDPDYASVRKELLATLDNWRKNVIHDKGVSEEFRKGGWPATYPTRSLQEWEAILELWKPWVFRDPAQKVRHPKFPAAGKVLTEQIRNR